MRPQLKPAVNRMWRDAHTVQLGLDPDHAVVIAGLAASEARLLAELDGTRDLRSIVESARDCGIPSERTHQLIELLDAAGVVDDATFDSRPLAALSIHDRDRLAPDLATWSLVHRCRDGGAGLLGRRGEAAVRVEGAGRVGALLAALLVAAGVGNVDVWDDAPASASDVGPGGISQVDVGTPRERALNRRTGAGHGRRPALRLLDLVVLCEPGPSSLLRSRDLVAAGQPHLVVSIRETVGVIGPLVVPGQSACGECLELTRAARDPAWPRVLAQLLNRRQPGQSRGVETVLATTVGAHAALQVLAHLDVGVVPGQEPSAGTAFNATWEVSLPHGQLRRRSWLPHPLCGCGAGT